MIAEEGIKLGKGNFKIEVKSVKKNMAMCYNSFSGGVGTIGIQSALQNIPAAEVFRSHRPRSHRQDLAELAGKREDFPCLFVQRATGDGKTTVARIFARALNCAAPETNEPCGECLSCREIAEGNSPDVVEIDAASNNGVDEIRDIREKVKFLPSGSEV